MVAVLVGRARVWSVVGVALFVAMTAGRADATPVASGTTPGVSVVQGRVEGVQVADEIVRRLRRLGINFMKSRLDHPYDPEGEYC